MISQITLTHFIYAWIAVAIVLFPVQLFISAPYGRHTKTSIGPMLSNQLGWVLMEAWALVSFFIIYAIYFNPDRYALFFAVLFLLHYINRSFIFPLRTKTEGKKMPMVIALSAMIFNSVNASINSYYLGNLSSYPVDYAFHWNFIAGLILFLSGFYINYKSDAILINLRQPGETDYKVPKGFLFKYISCPNHFGEMMEWFGYFLMCHNLASFAFLVWTVSNLLPRALHHHKWYLQNFNNYPKDRKAVFPYII